MYKKRLEQLMQPGLTDEESKKIDEIAERMWLSGVGHNPSEARESILTAIDRAFDASAVNTVHQLGRGYGTYLVKRPGED